MSFENVYRSREGIREITKITNFISSLVIKNNYEANASETSESIGEYYSYFGAYTKTDNFNDYSTDDRLKYQNVVYTYLKNLNIGLSDSELVSLPKFKRDELISKYKTSKLIQYYLIALRVARQYHYDEKNIYYRQFLGLPNTQNDYILLINFDAIGANEKGFIEADMDYDPDSNTTYYIYDNDSEEYVNVGKLEFWEDINQTYYYQLFIYAHDMNNINYPNTYTYYKLQKNIDTIIEKHPELTYLKFLSSEYTSFSLRNLPNYSIIQYDKSLLSSVELSYFFKAYNKAKTQIVADYIDGFDKKQPIYNVAMIMNLLYYTIIYYSNSYIERFTLSDYTEENLDDILDSHGYSKLKEISDKDIKRRIVMNLNDLIANKGNNYILGILLNKIIKSGNTELKRHYLEKKYNIDENFAVKIDTSKSLENSVELIFRETPALEDNTTESSDVYNDYDMFVESDREWGGINDTDSEYIMRYKRESLKKKILSLNFNSILTKYITLTKTVDILESQRNIRDSLYLMLNYFHENKSDIFFNTKTLFTNLNVTPSALFAAMCWLQQMKYYKDKDAEKIISDHTLINQTAAFRRFGRLNVDANSFERSFIRNGKVIQSFDITTELTDWNLKDFMIKDGEIETVQVGNILNYQTVAADGFRHIEVEKEDIKDYIIYYRYYLNGEPLGDFNSNTTFADLISDYQNQFPKMIKYITKRMKDSYDFREYQAWLFLLNQSRLDNSIEFIFNGYDNYPDYIRGSDSGELIFWIQSALTNNEYGINRLDRICNILSLITESFRTWVDTSFSTLVYKYSMDDSDDKYIADMILLFDEFLSAYSELYSVDYRYTFGDKEWQGLYLQLFYNPVFVTFNDSYTDSLKLLYKIKGSSIYDFYNDNINFFKYYGNSHDKYGFYESIIGDIHKDENGNYIPDDLIYEEYKVSIVNKTSTLIGFNSRIRTKERMVCDPGVIGLKDKLKITFNE